MMVFGTFLNYIAMFSRKIVYFLMNYRISIDSKDIIGQRNKYSILFL